MIGPADHRLCEERFGNEYESEYWGRHQHVYRAKQPAKFLVKMRHVHDDKGDCEYLMEEVIADDMGIHSDQPIRVMQHPARRP